MRSIRKLRGTQMNARGKPARRAATLAAALWLATVGSASAEWRLPNELEARLAGLDAVQREFIVSGAALDFMPVAQLEHELATRDEARIRKLVEDLMTVAGEMGYEPSRDMGAIPLNLTTNDFNRGTVPTPPPLRKDKRDPGPFSVSRYLFPESGVPTFAGARLAIWPEDLVAGDVDVAIIGVPNDMGSGRRNAEYGPRMMRALNTIGTPDGYSLVNPMTQLTVVDYGDFNIDNMSTERTVGHVAQMVAETAATGAVPMLVGGDTSMLYPGVKGVAEVHGKGAFGLVHFGAHPDVDRHAVHTISDTQALFLLLDEGIVEGGETVQVGLRGPAVDVDTLAWLREQGVRYHTMAQINRRGYDRVLKRVLDEVDDGPDKLFVSIDVSVIEPAEMVAAGRIVANGLRVSEVTQAIRHLCAAKEIVGFEITDMAPMLDFSRLSTVNANAVLNACLVGMAVRAAGLKPDYIHPLALDHGQD
jgi:arginase family enzyme